MNAINLILKPNPTDKTALLDTMQAFNSAKNAVLRGARQEDCFNKYKLSKLFYHQIKNDFLLPSQLAVSAITTVVEDSKKGSLPYNYSEFSDVFYDRRVVSFKGLTVASIATTIGRVQVNFTFDSYFEWDISPLQVGSALLQYNQGTFTLPTVICKQL